MGFCHNVNILGTEYTLSISTKEERPLLEDVDGYTDASTKEIIIDTFKKEKDSKQDVKQYTMQVIRHEVVHAYLEESGLSTNSAGCRSWATNEEMVDWFAIQFPKIEKTLKEICEVIKCA